MGKTYAERQIDRVACGECETVITAGSMLSHLMTRHGKAATWWHLWVPQTKGGGRTYKMHFPAKGGRRRCPVERCPGVLATGAAMCVHFVHRHVHSTVVGGGCPPPVSPRCCERAGAKSAPASPLVLPTPPGISLPGIVYCLLWPGNAFYTSWAPHLSEGAIGAAVLRTSHVESSNDSTWTQP